MFVWRFFPEMQRFPDDATRKMAWKQACRRSYPLDIIVFIAVIMIFSAMAMLTIGSGILDRLSPRLSAAFGLISGLFGIAIVARLRRNYIAKNIRRQLCHAGFLTCISCGYDLRGCTENRCSECGTPTRPNGATECSYGREPVE